MQKDIQVTGIGNALVDIQFEVSDVEIKELGFEKGTMTLVSREKQKEILEFLGHRSHNKCSGGSGANTIIAFSSMGGKSAYKTMLGHDSFGEFYSSEFADLGIILDSKYHADENTGICFVLISPDSERTMATFLGANSFHNYEHISDELIKRSEWIYLEGYKFTDETGRRAINHAVEIAKKYNTKIALTFSDKFVIDVFYDHLKPIAEQSDLIFCNEMEAKAYTRKESFDEAFDYLNANHKNLAITQGEKGAKVKWNNEIFDIPSYPCKPIDTTGAGDMFAGGFLYGITHWDNPSKAGHLGSISASRVISQLGARLNESHTQLRDKIKSL